MSTPFPTRPANGADVTEADGAQDLEPIGSDAELDEAADAPEDDNA